MKVPDVAPTSRVMVVAIVASMVAFVDGSVVNLALPATERDLGGGLALQQWVVDGYFLALAAIILPGGSASDLFGRVPVMRFGLTAFGMGSMLSAAASSPAVLVTGRVIQGLGGAFLVPGSLALINSAYELEDRPAAIGWWTACTGAAFALGPLAGGLIVDFLGWRCIYVLSATLAIIGLALTYWLHQVPAPAVHPRADVAGAALSSGGLAVAVYALIESQRRGWSDPLIALLVVVGVAMLLAFAAWERRATHPMLPMAMFTIRNFTAVNLATAFVYGGLAMGSLSTALYLQEVVGYPAIVAGLITLPTPIISLLFARRVGRLATRIGPRIFLTIGPMLAALGYLLIRPDAHGFNVFTDILPGRLVLATGLVLTITPLTALNLSSVESSRSGIAAAIQNAVGRTSALIAVGCVGIIVGGTLSDASFARLLEVSASSFFIAAVIGAVMITNVAVPAGVRPP